MTQSILHVLSQRPGRTGSGVTLDALVRLAARDDWRQEALVGVPGDEAAPDVGGLPAAAVRRVTFAGKGRAAADLPFPVPGMSDVMPYPSSVWSALTASQLETYRAAWRDRLAAAVREFQPDLVHVNHIWIVASLLKDVAPEVPAVAACHATGLRQMELCPHLADEVRRGCARLDRFCVLHEEHRRRLSGVLGIDPGRVAVVGAGYRDDLFRGPPSPASARRDRILYVGKYSEAKGLPWLLDAVATLAATRPGLRLHVAGSGAGPEADALAARMDAMAPLVVRHGALAQDELAELMRGCAVLALPSFYEGVPLVLAEAAACGCRLVATALPGVVAEIAPRLASRLDLVPPPRLRAVDRPELADLPEFTSTLVDALRRCLASEPAAPPPAPDLAPFTWAAVYGRVARIWRSLLS